MSASARIAAACGVLVLSAAAATAADEPPKRSWTDVAELGLVLTNGNTETVTFAATNKFVYTWTNADLTVDAGALRTDTSTPDPKNIDGVLVVDDTKKTTAAAYLLTSKYRQTIREGFLWYVHLGGNRNRFSGIAARYFVGAGVGYRFIQTPKHTLVGEFGVNFNDEFYIEESLDDRASFADLRAFLSYEFRISDSAKLTDEFEVLMNPKESRDLRLRNVAAVVASLSKKVALKVSLTAVYDREPVVKVLQDTVPPDDGPVTYTLDNLDSVLAASIVINF